MQQVHLFISGFVQGVGFRQFVTYNAKKMGVSGWVKNLPDGRVEALLQGSRESLEPMIRRLKKGPFIAKVEYVDVRWEEIEDTFEVFEIIK